MEKTAIANDVLLERLINAPVQLVWMAWTDPKHVAKWWGPDNFTNPVCLWDAKPGNDILVNMKGPDNTNHPMTGKFLEVVENKKLVFNASAVDDSGKPLFEVLTTVEFIQQSDNKTLLKINVSPTGILPEGIGHIEGMHEGWTQSLGRFEKVADKLNDKVSSIDKENVTLTINR